MEVKEFLLPLSTAYGIRPDQLGEEEVRIIRAVPHSCRQEYIRAVADYLSSLSLSQAVRKAFDDVVCSTPAPTVEGDWERLASLKKFALSALKEAGAPERAIRKLEREFKAVEEALKGGKELEAEKLLYRAEDLFYGLLARHTDTGKECREEAKKKLLSLPAAQMWLDEVKKQTYLALVRECLRKQTKTPEWTFVKLYP